MYIRDKTTAGISSVFDFLWTGSSSLLSSALFWGSVSYNRLKSMALNKN
jgi:hypothetical protein